MILLVLILEFKSHRGEILYLLQKKNKNNTLFRPPRVVDGARTGENLLAIKMPGVNRSVWGGRNMEHLITLFFSGLKALVATGYHGVLLCE